ncbi:MAG: RIP metalloprotease RseP [Candidatus Omnitrophica bacterium]|nr:RIP metalloprotease RseP [Candidatus Omnitrophota bacterium]
MLIFLAVLSVLIIVHEFGHFIVARCLGIRVERFSLGFGPKLFSIKGKQTEYVICLIPLGGYVKMAGDSRESYSGKRYEFLARPLKDRAKVIITGPLFNYLMSFFCFWCIFFIGFPVLTTSVGGLLEDMPAKHAGIQIGDIITSIDGKDTQYWEDVASIIHDKEEGEVVNLGIVRDGEEINLTVGPEFKKTKNLLGEEVTIALIGISPSEETVKVSYGLFPALAKGTERLFDITSLTLQALSRMLLGSLSLRESVTGPLGIFFATNKAFEFGPAALLHVVAVLGVSLAIFNLLPIPLLDGGHLLFLLIERIRKKPLSDKTEELLNRASLALLLVLVAFVFYNDLIRYKVIEKIVEFFSFL